jgi:hypothetical protein
LAVVRPIVERHLERRARGEKHPIEDFLFAYYSFRPAHLLRWSPGVGRTLNDATIADVGWHQFQTTKRGLILPADQIPESRRRFCDWATSYCEAVAARPPKFGCLGLHEWAMVYRTDDIRHSGLRLRLSEDEIARTVEHLGLDCTHYDAYRFFTPAALPRNSLPLSRELGATTDQPGCIHANMDLYKFAYKLSPWIDAAILADAFQLATAARMVDMRASPYDVSQLGEDPIPIETVAGREEYVRLQGVLSVAASVVRAELVVELRRMKKALEV